VEFLPGALDALFHAGQLGWNIYLIGNEDAVAFGELSEGAWKKIEAHIEDALRDHGIPLKRSYACLEHPETGGPHAQPSVFRLPETGAFYHAMHNDGIDLSKSWVIGDSTIELAAAWRADLHSIGVRTGVALGDETLSVEPAFIAEDLASAITALTRAGAEAA
jgi:histidinol phosphatase-like enzyme